MDVIAWVSILAITFHPLHVSLTRKTGHTALSAAIASALVVGAFVIPLLFVAGLAINELLAVGQSLQQAFTDDRGIDTTTPWGQADACLNGRLGFDAEELVTWVRQHANELAAGMGHRGDQRRRQLLAAAARRGSCRAERTGDVLRSARRPAGLRRTRDCARTSSVRDRSLDRRCVDRENAPGSGRD